MIQNLYKLLASLYQRKLWYDDNKQSKTLFLLAYLHEDSEQT